MWALVRVIALAVAAGTALLLAGQGGWLLSIWDRAAGLIGTGAVTPGGRGALTQPTALAAMTVGGAAALTRPADRVVGQLVTLLHELGHTVVAAALGARPAGIVLRHDASGHATARWIGRPGPSRRFALALVAFAGLPAAATASAAGAHLVGLAGAEPVLWTAAAAGVLVAVLARTVWSLLVAAGLAALTVAALSAAAAPWAGGVVVGVLTAVAVKSTRDNARALGRRIAPGDDARVVTGYIGLPARLVQFVQVVVAGALSVWTIWLLLPPLAGLALWD